MKKKEGNVIVKTIKIALVLLVLMSGVLFVVYVAAPEKISTPATTTQGITVSAPRSLEEAKRQYEEKRDLRALLAYGSNLEADMLVMDSVRAALEKHFFHELAQEAGRRYNIKWNILYGLWMRESSINPQAKGDGKFDHNGRLIPGSFRAFGLGQVHLNTARAHYDSNITEERLLDPIENGMASASVLRDYTAMFGGNIKYGISAYQQGPKETKKQFKDRVQPKNISYVIDVLQFAAEAN